MLILFTALLSALLTRLQIRADVTILNPGALPRTTYKTPLLHVREQPGVHSARDPVRRQE